MLATKLTSKYQATVPREVRKVLDLKQGDRLKFEIKNDVVILKKALPPDLDYLRSLNDSLSEWNSSDDDDAYRDLQSL